MTVYHKHHIIPKHAGGTNDISNIVVLTVEEHAEAHRLLFEKYGRWQDELAWRALSGQINTAEINRLKAVLRNTGKNNHMYGKPSPMRGKKHTEETRQKIKIKRSMQVMKPVSYETRLKMSQKLKGRTLHENTRRAVIESNKRRAGLKHRLHKNKGVTLINVICPHCNKVGGGNAMHRWHFDNCKLKV